MLALRQTKVWTLVASALVLGAANAPALAEGKLEARYTVTLAGIPIGSGNWTVDINDTHYTASASGTTTGLMKAFTGGFGSSGVRGTLNGGKLLNSLYASTISTRKKQDTVRLTIANGNVKDFSVDPPPDDDPERVPVTEANRQGVVDPLTSSLMRVPGNGNPLTPEACQHSLSVFDGRLRYDLQLAYKRMEQVKADKGYGGPALVCAVYFSPVAGFIPSRSAIKYLSKLRDIEIWLVPIAGTRVLAPFRAQGPTPVGHVVLEADQFVTTATPARATASGAKTQ